MTADPMVPDEAVEAAMGVKNPYPVSPATYRDYMRRLLAAAMPALTAASGVSMLTSDEREELERLRGAVASVHALADEACTIRDGSMMVKHDGTKFPANVDANALRAAVSDDGIANHNQQMRAEAWDEGYEAGALAARGDDSPNPYRTEGQEP